jgi:hypothetical protein
MRWFLFLVLLAPCSLSGQIVNIEEMRIKGTNDSLMWYGALKGAYSATKVQEKTTVLRAEAQVQFKKKRHIALLLLNANFLRAGSQDFINNSFVHLRYNLKWTKSTSWELLTQQQANKLILIKQRGLLGTGLRQRFFIDHKSNSRLYLGITYLLERNQFLSESTVVQWHRLSNYLTMTLRKNGNGAVLQLTTYWQPVIGQIKNYRLSTECALELPIGKHLRYSTDFSLSKDTGLPTLAPRQIYQWQNGLVWRL